MNTSSSFRKLKNDKLLSNIELFIPQFDSGLYAGIGGIQTKKNYAKILH